MIIRRMGANATPQTIGSHRCHSQHVTSGGSRRSCCDAFCRGARRSRSWEARSGSSGEAERPSDQSHPRCSRGAASVLVLGGRHSKSRILAGRDDRNSGGAHERALPTDHEPLDVYLRHSAPVNVLPRSGFVQDPQVLSYFRKHRQRMRHFELRELGMPVGSGPVEAACKSLVAQRMKQSGMRYGRALEAPGLSDFCCGQPRLLAPTRRSAIFRHRPVRQ